MNIYQITRTNDVVQKINNIPTYEVHNINVNINDVVYISKEQNVDIVNNLIVDHNVVEVYL